MSCLCGLLYIYVLLCMVLRSFTFLFCLLHVLFRLPHVVCLRLLHFVFACVDASRVDLYLARAVLCVT